MVGLHINPKNQRQFNYLRILTLSLSIILDEDGIQAVKDLYNTLFTEYYIQVPEQHKSIDKPALKDLMDKFILKGDLPQTLSEWWYYYLVLDCLTFASNFDTYADSFNRKLDNDLKKFGYLLASDMRNYVREEIRIISPEARWMTSSDDPCDECKARDGMLLKDIKDLTIHPNCKCFIVYK